MKTLKLDIRDGMIVIDKNDELVGLVKYVQHAATEAGSTAVKKANSTEDNINARYEDDAFFRELVDALVGESQTPEVVAEQLIEKGYLHIEGEDESTNQIAMIDQIASVAGNHIKLTIEKQLLIQM